MKTYTLEPEVDAVREFLEIAGDFTDPLEVVREAVSNSMDAGAKSVSISFGIDKSGGKRTLQILIEDDGEGMSNDGLKSFFDLGNSPKRARPELIGEKGHGTKVYFNCEQLRVDTLRDGLALSARMEHPFATLHDGRLPSVEVTESAAREGEHGTAILIRGFNHNNGEPFTHERLKDYIRWFTKFGSFERVFGIEDNKEKSVLLKGLDREKPEFIPFGHIFPEDSPPIVKLLDEYLVRSPDYYSKKVVKRGTLRRHPDIGWNAIFSIEGNKVKQSYNPMLRRPGYSAPPGAYTVQDRYGVWLCKDFIPIEQKNAWISTRGTEFTKFHAFFNCQELSLTANRGSCKNTPTPILEDIQEAISEMYEDIISGDEWREIEWLESEASAHNTAQKEQRDFQWRKTRANATNVASLNGVTLVEPTRESGVYALLVQLVALKPDILPFEVVDYETHSGIDIIGKARGAASVGESALFYIELKHTLEKSMNHCFANIKNIVCWDSELKHGERISDLSREERELHVVPPNREDDYTGYFLRHDRKNQIEVIVLKDYLRERLGLDFRPRHTANLATP